MALQEKGLGIAEALADKGMSIVIVVRNGEKAEAAAGKIRANGVPGVRRADGCQGS